MQQPKKLPRPPNILEEEILPQGDGFLTTKTEEVSPQRLVEDYSSILLLCAPGDVYKGMSEKEVDRAYTQMAIKDFDRLVEFRPEYRPFMETPDATVVAGQKGDRKLVMSLFIQPIIRIGNLEADIEAWSYLFNPESKYGLLPDLDAIHLRKGNKVREAAEIIKEFYESYGWQTYILEDDLPKRDTMVGVNPERNLTPGDRVAIMSPSELRRIAYGKLNYSLDELCF